MTDSPTTTVATGRAAFRDLSRPTLGVCLGPQVLCAALDASGGRAPAVVRRNATPVGRDGEGVSTGRGKRLVANHAESGGGGDA